MGGSLGGGGQEGEKLGGSNDQVIKSLTRQAVAQPEVLQPAGE